MSKRIINILCEGQSEQEFALKVLKPYLLPYDIIVRTNVVITNRKEGAQGGLINYLKVKKDLSNMINAARDTSYEKNFFTTMFDLYALPSDFPGFDAFTQKMSPYDGVDSLEQALSADVNHYRFVPYIELHELETLVLCNPKSLINEYPNASNEIVKMDLDWRKEFENQVELVNTSRESSPSHRIINALEGKYNYDKRRMASVATKSKGIDALRAECPHFNQWIEKLLQIQ